MTNELKSLNDRCNILTDVLRKRDCQLRKAKQEIEILQTHNNSLQKVIKFKERKYMRLLNKFAELNYKRKPVVFIIFYLINSTLVFVIIIICK